MMPAIDRLRRAAIAADLAATARETDAGPRHAARLARLLGNRPRPATTLADLDAAPAWLRGGERAPLAMHAALMLAAPHLARCIDGARLQALAAAAGAEALDRAIALGAGRDPAGVPDIDPETLAAIGHGVLAACLSPALAALLPPAIPVDRELARAALAEAVA